MVEMAIHTKESSLCVCVCVCARARVRVRVLPVFLSAEWLDDWKKYIAGGSITFREMSVQGT
jgi:hypothetical protein